MSSPVSPDADERTPVTATATGTGRLRVLVNLTWLVPGVVGGSEESTTDALRALLEHRDDIEPTLAVLGGFASAHPDLAESCRCEVLRRSGGNKVARVVAEQTWLARRTRALAPDLVHHAGGVVPVRHPGRCVVTIHDLQPLDQPANFSLTKRAYLRAMLGRSVRAAEIVCVPSRFTRQRVVERLGVPRERVELVPWSLTEPVRVAPRTDRSSPDTDPSRPVFLYPAITYPHKNHAVLLEAFALVRRQLPGARLVLAGGPGPSEPQVMARAARDDLSGHVERLGRVPQAEMARLYRTATAVVVPSLYEGFGLPALEAMAHGVPLVVSAAGSLPEVVAAGGDPATAVEPVDPADPAAWATAMETVAGLDPLHRAAVVEAGFVSAAMFTPRRTADALAAAYRRAAHRAV